MNRRRFVYSSGLVVTGMAVAAVANVSAVAAATTPPPAPAKNLVVIPTRYGSPTDLARTSNQTAWTRDHDGTVLRYDKRGQLWRQDAQQKWATVLRYGTVVVSRWGRPSGSNALVMVFGTAPQVVPAKKPIPPKKQITLPVPPKPTLAATGFDTPRLTLAGIGAVALGGLIAARNRGARRHGQAVRGSNGVEGTQG